MKVLQQVCGYCGNVQFYSVEVICRPGTREDIGPKTCPFCEKRLGVVVTATELDLAEVQPDPDIDQIFRSIQKFPESKPERG